MALLAIPGSLVNPWRIHTHGLINVFHDEQSGMQYDSKHRVPQSGAGTALNTEYFFHIHLGFFDDVADVAGFQNIISLSLVMDHLMIDRLVKGMSPHSPHHNWQIFAVGQDRADATIEGLDILICGTPSTDTVQQLCILWIPA
jgi:hypothetical protein